MARILRGAIYKLESMSKQAVGLPVTTCRSSGGSDDGMDEARCWAQDFRRADEELGMSTSVPRNDLNSPSTS